MLAGLSDEQLGAFHLKRDAPYRLLHNNGKPVEGFQQRDSANFKSLCEALQTVGHNEAQVQGVLGILAGLIHLGDAAVEDENGIPKLAPVENEDDVPVVEINTESVQKAAELLGFDPVELASALKRKRFQIKGRESIHKVARTPMQFRQALHSLIKALYKRIFDQTVARINASFGGDGDAEERWRHIGILDIYGFERLKRNSFEQLCINLANERLQQYFVENVLTAEQELYKREALAWTDLAIPDSTPVVRCISTVFAAVDDFSGRLAKGLEKDATDEKFCQRIVDECAKDEKRRDVLRKPLVSGRSRRSLGGFDANESFTIKHYAGMVEYCTAGWLDKNNDRLLAECEDLIADSSNPAVSILTDDLDKGQSGAANVQKSPFRSISKKYQQDLEALLQTLSTCNLHYIRCFKPNEEQKPKLFKQTLVLEQIVQCGTIELVKIMHDGYPNRCSFNEINERFRCMLPASFQRYGTRTFIEALMLAYQIPREQWELGMSRLFLKAGQLKKLEDLRSDGAAPDADVLAKIVSGLVRKRWTRAGHAVRLSLYLPKLMQEINVRRAATALSRAALVTGRLACRLEAAKARIAQRRLMARRRLKSRLSVVCFLTAEWRRMRAARRERVERALHIATFIAVRTRWWVVIGRPRAVEAESQREAELRRLEDKRKQMEEQRKRMEIEHKEAEKRREEERLLEEERRKDEEALRKVQWEKQRLEEEQRLERELQERAKLREEEDRRRADEAAREQEEKQKALEQDRLKVLEERKRLEEEKQQLEDEKKAFEASQAEVERQSTVLSGATPQGSRRASLSKRASLTGSEVVPDSMTPTTPMDSVSMVPSHSNNNEHELKIQQMEERMARAQEETLRQMQEMQQKNELLQRQNEVLQQQKIQQHEEKRLEEEEAGPRQRLEASPAAARNASPISLPSPGTPPRDEGAVGTGRVSKAPSSARRYSLISDFSSAGRRQSMTGTRKPRQSLAVDALRAPMGGSTNDVEQTNVVRSWWGEQRSFLMDDLYPMGSPVQSRGGSSAKKRQSLPGGSFCAALGSAPSLPTQQRPEQRGPTPADSRPTWSTDLNSRFATVAEAAGSAAAADVPRSSGGLSLQAVEHDDEPLANGTPNGTPKGEMSGVSASSRSAEQGTKMKQPTKFHWGKRNSVAGDSRC
jgi:myosin heavy subunit